MLDYRFYDQAPRFGTCTQQRANQCDRKCDSDLKILECGIGITAILVWKPHEDKLGNTSLAAIVNAPAIYLLSARKQCGDFEPLTCAQSESD